MQIAENALGFLKPNSMFGPIAPILPFIPIESTCLDNI
jgi:hypothetical protein